MDIKYALNTFDPNKTTVKVKVGEVEYEMSANNFFNNIPKPYKSYIALVTQTGADNISNINSGELTIGVTYTIEENFNNSDFTNVGAPNNNVGTSFVATGTTPNTWNINDSLNYNTGAPTVKVLENTIGNIWFTFDSDGLYYANSNGLFVENNSPVILGTLSTNIFSAYSINSNLFEISTFNVPSGANQNDKLQNTVLEIRVYN